MLANICGQNAGAPSTSVVNYIPICGFNSTPTATETARLAPISGAFTLQNFYVSATPAPSTGKSYTYTVRKNQVDTGITITISDTNTSGVYSGAGVSFAAGDTIDIGITPSGTPTAPTQMYWNLQADSGNSNHFAPVIGGAAATTGLSNSVTNYAHLMSVTSSTAWDVTESNHEMVIPCNGTIDNLYVLADAVVGIGKTWAITLVKNGSATTLSASITGNTLKSGNDTTHSVSVSAGDMLSIQAVPTSTPAISRIFWAVRFTPTVPGQSFLGFGSSSAPSTTATQYEGPMGIGGGSFSGTESSRQIAPGACMLTALYAMLGTAPGGSTTRTLTIRRDAVSSPIAVSFTGTAVTGNHSGENVGLGKTNLISLQVSETGTPAADTGGVHVGILQFIPTATANTTNFLGFMK